MCLPCLGANYIKSGLGNVLHVPSIFFVLIISYLVVMTCFFGLVVSVHGHCSKTGDKGRSQMHGHYSKPGDKWAASRAPLFLFGIYENKQAEQFCSFSYIDITVPQLSTSEITIYQPYSMAESLVCVGPDLKRRKRFISQRGSNHII